MNHLFTSERLGFRNWTESDIPKMAAISSNPEVMRFFPGVQDYDHTARFVVEMMEHFTKHGYCYFATELVTTGEFIGFIGMKWVDLNRRSFTDIGWRIAPEHWGKGYATEGAVRCLRFAFEDLNMSEIFAIAPKVNSASISVMKKAGMRFVEEFDHPLLMNDKRLRNCVLYSRSEHENF